jgi:hypothetical protein
MLAMASKALSLDVLSRDIYMVRYLMKGTLYWALEVIIEMIALPCIHDIL